MLHELGRRMQLVAANDLFELAVTKGIASLILELNHGIAVEQRLQKMRVRNALEQIPEELVVDLVVVLDFRWFDEGAESTRAAIGGVLFEVGVTDLYVSA